MFDRDVADLVQVAPNLKSICKDTTFDITNVVGLRLTTQQLPAKGNKTKQNKTNKTKQNKTKHECH
jgi:hypothetical protein